MQLDGEDDDEQQQEADEPQEEEEEEEHAAEGDGNESAAEGKQSASGAAASAAASSTTPLKRPMTAYFLFLAAERPAIIAQLEAETAAENAAAIAAAAAAGTEPVPVKSKSRNVALIGKMLGDKWKQLTPEEKEPFLARHTELKAAYDAAILADPSLASKRGGGGASKPSGGAGHEDGALSHDILLPLARIKKVIDLDQDRSRMTKEALLVTEKAAVREKQRTTRDAGARYK